MRKFLEKFDFRKTELPKKSRKFFHGTQPTFIKFFSTKNKLSIILNWKKYRYYQYFVAKVSISIPNFFDTCHHRAHNISHHTHTICKRAELMSKTYKNGLFLNKSVQKSKNPYFWKNLYKNPYKNGFLKKIRTCMDKFVRVGTLTFG